ncbi:calcium sensing receptor [Populus alba x Populus x berolinensis]|nr:calcium sensing receptor [Populus alba x Populus x berolinensis]
MAMEIAIRSSFTTRLSPRSTSSATKPSFFKPHPLRPISVSLPTSTLTISLLSLFAPPNEAKALTISKDQVVSTLTDVEKTIDQAVEFSSSVLDSAQKVFEGVTSSLKPGIDVALPIAKQAGEQAVKIASPAISEASKKAQEAIQSTGIDTEPVLSAAKTVVGAAQQTTKVIEEAKPIASSTVEAITSADPVVIVGAAGAVFLAYLLFPSIWSAVSFGLRGYKGEITPAQVLDLLSTKNYIMIDIRSEKDKEKAGIPRLPSSAKNQMVSVPLEELPSKLKGIVRNVKKLEAEIAALKISYLKKINKGSNIVIMDS